MLNIKTPTENFTKYEIYAMTISPDIKVIKDLEDGTVLNVVKYLEFDDTNDRGETNELLSLYTDGGECYTVQSKTFKSAFYDIVDIFGTDPYVSIIKKSGISKSERNYVTCIANAEYYR